MQSVFQGIFLWFQNDNDFFFFNRGGNSTKQEIEKKKFEMEW